MTMVDSAVRGVPMSAQPIVLYSLQANQKFYRLTIVSATYWLQYAAEYSHTLYNFADELDKVFSLTTDLSLDPEAATPDEQPEDESVVIDDKQKELTELEKRLRDTDERLRRRREELEQAEKSKVERDKRRKEERERFQENMKVLEQHSPKRQTADDHASSIFSNDSRAQTTKSLLFEDNDSYLMSTKSKNVAPSRKGSNERLTYSSSREHLRQSATMFTEKMKSLKASTRTAYEGSTDASTTDTTRSSAQSTDKTSEKSSRKTADGFRKAGGAMKSLPSLLKRGRVTSNSNE
ncbi:hypothetical protein V1511DRAFT_502212 [Dipodascopsis uninucleata]